VRDEQRADAAPAARESDRQRAAYRADLPVERQLSDDDERPQTTLVQRAGRRQDAECDREIEGGALLPQPGRREVHGDAIGGEGESGVADRRPHTLAALPHRRVGKTHRREGRQSRGDVDFHAHEGGVDAS